MNIVNLKEIMRPTIQTIAKTIQTGQFFYIFPHYYYQWRRKIDIEKTKPSITKFINEQSVYEIHMLTGSKQHIDLIYSAKSFINHFRFNCKLIVHADKTLTDRDEKRIIKHFPKAKILRKYDRDKLVVPHLKTRQMFNCIRFRDRNPLAAKIIDVGIVSQSEKVIILDTDCLTLKSLENLSTKLYDDVSIFGKDPKPYPYCAPKEQLEKYFSLDISPHINTGLCVIKRDLLNLGVVEKWLSNPDYPMDSHFAEQTILAALASKHNIYFLSETECNVGRTLEENNCNFVHYCGHYLSETRINMRKIGQPMVLSNLS